MVGSANLWLCFAGNRTNGYRRMKIVEIVDAFGKTAESEFTGRTHPTLNLISQEHFLGTSYVKTPCHSIILTIRASLISAITELQTESCSQLVETESRISQY